jgi:adenylate cyclase
VIFLSALSEAFDKVKAFSIGGVDYITKPFQAEEVLVRVETHLSLRKLQKRLKETFGIYVAQEVRDEVLANRIPLDGEMKDVTVLFADLRDFTPLTESTPPKEVVRILNDYFTEMAPAIHRHQGSILRYVGDEIYAVFGAPLSLNDHPNHAVEAALDMRRCLKVVNERMEQQGYAPLRQGIGIHSGRVVAANIGSPDRLSYDLVGDTVNLASRIQELTKMFSTDIIISATTKARLHGDFAVEKVPAITIKGKKDPVEIFKVL